MKIIKANADLTVHCACFFFSSVSFSFSFDVMVRAAEPLGDCLGAAVELELRPVPWAHVFSS